MTTPTETAARPDPAFFKLIPFHELCARWGISKETLRRYRNAGRIRGVKIGKHVYFDPKECEAFVKAQTDDDGTVRMRDRR